MNISSAESISFTTHSADYSAPICGIYSIYLKFNKPLAPNETSSWLLLSQTQSWKSWSGYAYENICYTHIHKIKQALGISGVHTNEYSYVSKPADAMEGLQIDLLIDRQDHAISLCEVKFYNDEWVLSKSDAEALRRKRSMFKHYTQTKKQIYLVLITTFGLINNKNSIGLIDNHLSMNDLF